MDHTSNNYHQSVENIINNKEELKQTTQRSTTDIILELTKGKCLDLFNDQFGEPHAIIEINNNFQIISIESPKLELWITKIFREKYQFIPPPEAVHNAIRGLKADAVFDHGVYILNLRVAQYEDSWYYDLTNREWEMIEITADGWNIKKLNMETKVFFKRYGNHKKQVYPSKQYPVDIIERFFNLLNIKDEDIKLLLICYIILLFIPQILKPLLIIDGEQGSAKSTTQEIIKMLVDPSEVKTLTFPKDIKELIQVLAHNYIAFFDNTSRIPEWTSDQLCRAVTGAGFSKRALYKNDDDIIYNFKGCIGINGINFGALKTDLLDRAIKIKQNRITDEENKLPEDIWAKFEEIKPQLLGYILDILVKVKQFIASGQKLNLNKHPRMAEFAKYGEIISRCMGYSENRFINAYYKNIGLQTQEVIDSDTIASLVVSLMVDKKEWIGTITNLGEELKTLAELQKIDTNSKFWPKAPKSLANRLEMVKTILRSAGIIVERRKDTSKNLTLVWLRKNIPDSPDSPEPENHAQNTGTTPEQISDKNYSPEDSPKIHAQKPDYGTTGTTGAFCGYSKETLRNDPVLAENTVLDPNNKTDISISEPTKHILFQHIFPCLHCHQKFESEEYMIKHSINKHPIRSAFLSS